MSDLPEDYDFRYALQSNIPGYRMPEVVTLHKCDLRIYKNCHLKTFKVAQGEALVENMTALRKMEQKVEDFKQSFGTADRPFMDFMKPDGMTEPLYKIGENVFVVSVTDCLGLDVSACRGDIIGMEWHPATSYLDKVHDRKPGWVYDVFYLRKQEWNPETGSLVPATLHVREEDIATSKEEAKRRLDEFLEEYKTKMNKFIDALGQLKPEKMVMEQAWTPRD